MVRAFGQIVWPIRNLLATKFLNPITFLDGPKWRPFNSIMNGLSSNKDAMEMMPVNPMALHGQPNGQVRK